MGPPITIQLCAGFTVTSAVEVRLFEMAEEPLSELVEDSLVSEASEVVSVVLEALLDSSLHKLVSSAPSELPEVSSVVYVT